MRATPIELAVFAGLPVEYQDWRSFKASLWEARRVALMTVPYGWPRDVERVFPVGVLDLCWQELGNDDLRSSLAKVLSPLFNVRPVYLHEYKRYVFIGREMSILAMRTYLIFVHAFFENSWVPFCCRFETMRPTVVWKGLIEEMTPYVQNIVTKAPIPSIEDAHVRAKSQQTYNTYFTTARWHKQLPNKTNTCLWTLEEEQAQFRNERDADQLWERSRAMVRWCGLQSSSWDDFYQFEKNRLQTPRLYGLSLEERRSLSCPNPFLHDGPRPLSVLRRTKGKKA